VQRIKEESNLLRIHTLLLMDQKVEKKELKKRKGNPKGTPKDTNEISREPISTPIPTILGNSQMISPPSTQVFMGN
jgi:hypothetical protein